MPFLEWRFGEATVEEEISAILVNGHPDITLVECAYHMGHFEQAVKAADLLMESSSEPPSAMVAMCLKIAALMMMGNGQAASSCLPHAVEMCRSGCQSEDADTRSFSVVCLSLLEDLLCLQLADDDLEIRHLEDMPSGLRAYCGFLLAMRMYHRGEDRESIGAVHGFIALVGHRYPVSCVKLRLVAAAAYLRLGEIEAAVGEYDKAWSLARPLGIRAPFVEMSSAIPGLLRRHLDECAEKDRLFLRNAVAQYRKSWHYLRARCHRPVAGEGLSIMEYTVSAMAVWGWSNRDIASFLELSENTVKHYLTGAYQVLGVKSRRELGELFMSTFGE